MKRATRPLIFSRMRLMLAINVFGSEHVAVMKFDALTNFQGYVRPSLLTVTFSARNGLTWPSSAMEVSGSA